jgi:hypothetical protein
MAKLSASEYAAKWSRRLKGATEDVRAGINRVTVAPGEQAAKAQDLMKTKLNASIDDGTWAAQTRAVSLAEWQDKAANKGVNRIAAGVDSASQSQVSMAEKLLPAVDRAAAKANALPKGSIEDSVNRAATFIREMGANKLRRPAGR